MRIAVDTIRRMTGAAALARFPDFVQAHAKVWIYRRADIARHWKVLHPHQP